MQHYFVELYEKELPRLTNMVNVEESHLSENARERFLNEVCSLITKVIIPAYVRLAAHYSPRERNDFYLVPERFHGLERVGWGIVGIAAGAFVVWAPFIPIWSKEFILPFMIAGLILPDLRRLYSMKHYESELNQMVTKADREIGRIEMAYLTSETAMGVTSFSEKEQGPKSEDHEPDVSIENKKDGIRGRIKQ